MHADEKVGEMPVINKLIEELKVEIYEWRPEKKLISVFSSSYFQDFYVNRILMTTKSFFKKRYKYHFFRNK